MSMNNRRGIVAGPDRTLKHHDRTPDRGPLGGNHMQRSVRVVAYKFMVFELDNNFAMNEMSCFVLLSWFTYACNSI